LFYRCAASRAESLRLSVKRTILFAAGPPEAKPLFFYGDRKARGFPHGEAAQPQPNGFTKVQDPKVL